MAWASPQLLLPVRQVAAVLGSQWGDEGKGKLVDILAQQYDVVARAQVLAFRDSGWHMPMLCSFRPYSSSLQGASTGWLC